MFLGTVVYLSKIITWWARELTVAKLTGDTNSLTLLTIRSGQGRIKAISPLPPRQKILLEGYFLIFSVIKDAFFDFFDDLRVDTAAETLVGSNGDDESAGRSRCLVFFLKVIFVSKHLGDTVDSEVATTELRNYLTRRLCSLAILVAAIIFIAFVILEIFSMVFIRIRIVFIDALIRYEYYLKL